MSQETRSDTHTAFFWSGMPADQPPHDDSPSADVTAATIHERHPNGEVERHAKLSTDILSAGRVEAAKTPLRYRVRQVENSAFVRPSWCHPMQEIRIYVIRGRKSQHSEGLAACGKGAAWGKMSMGTLLMSMGV